MREGAPVPSFDSSLANRTTTKLLDALREGNNEPAWVQIDTRYRPVVAGLARRLGLSDSDAEETAQRTLAEFVRAYRDGKYDRTKGRLSSWILGIAHNTALRVQRESRRGGMIGMDEVSDVADEDSLRTIWTDERDRSILSHAMDLIRAESGIDDRTLLAFELVAIRGVPPAEAAAQSSMTVDQVYVAKTRVTKRLRRVVEELTAAFEQDM